MNRLCELATRPGDVWQEIKEDPVSIGELYVRYILPLAAIPPIARIIGLTLIGVSFLGVRYRSSLLNAVGYGLVSYFLSLFALFFAAIVTNALAPYFGSRKNLNQALKVVTYASIPHWAAGMLLVVPGLSSLVTLISLYGYYLLYRGLPILMGTPRSALPIYFLALVSLSVILVFAISSIATVLFLQGRLAAG